MLNNNKNDKNNNKREYKILPGNLIILKCLKIPYVAPLVPLYSVIDNNRVDFPEDSKRIHCRLIYYHEDPPLLYLGKASYKDAYDRNRSWHIVLHEGKCYGLLLPSALYYVGERKHRRVNANIIEIVFEKVKL